MKPTPLAPVLPDDATGPRWGLAASVLGHGLILLALLGFAIRHLPPDGNPAPSFDLVFEGPNGAAPHTDAAKTAKLPPAQPADLEPPPDAEIGPPAPTPLSRPDPDATTAPPPAAEAAPPPQPQPAPAAPQPVPAQPQPATTAATAQPQSAAPPPVTIVPPSELATLPEPPPVPAPPVPAEPPAVRLDLPPPEAAPATSAPIMPQPPPLPPEPRPRPVRPTARAAPPSPFGTLSNPMNLSLGPASPRRAARGSVASRSLDLSPPPEHDGPARSDPYAQIRAANASADWNRGLLQYWLRHRFYPEQAAANGEQGEVTIQLTVNRSGRVENVEVLSRSGSQWLDMAAVATWRDARLPPFTNEMREDRITFPVPIQYTLIMR